MGIDLAQRWKDDARKAWYHVAVRAHAEAFAAFRRAATSFVQTGEATVLEAFVAEHRDCWAALLATATHELSDGELARAVATLRRPDLGLVDLVDDAVAAVEPGRMVSRHLWETLRGTCESVVQQERRLEMSSASTAAAMDEAVRVFLGSALQELAALVEAPQTLTRRLIAAADAIDPVVERARAASPSTPWSHAERLGHALGVTYSPFDDVPSVGCYYNILEPDSARRLIPQRTIIDPDEAWHYEVYDALHGTVSGPGHGGPVFWAQGAELRAFLDEIATTRWKIPDATALAREELEATHVAAPTDARVAEVAAGFHDQVGRAVDGFIKGAQHVADAGDVLVCWDEKRGW